MKDQIPDRYEELAGIWIQKAADDINWAKDSFEDGHYGGVCFLCQQAAEKALKAYLFSLKVKLVRTHDLERLLEMAVSYESQFLVLKRDCQILNDYYTDTRYPDIWDVGRFENRELAAQAIKSADEVVDKILAKLTVTGTRS